MAWRLLLDKYPGLPKLFEEVMVDGPVLIPVYLQDPQPGLVGGLPQGCHIAPIFARAHCEPHCSLTIASHHQDGVPPHSSKIPSHLEHCLELQQH